MKLKHNPQKNTYNLQNLSCQKTISENKDIVQISQKLLERRLWNTIEDLKIVNQIISKRRYKNQQFTINRLNLINAIEAVKKEILDIERIFLNDKLKG